MPRHKRVVLALAALGIARKPALGADGRKPIEPARQQLVGIRLVPHIPDDLVLWGFKHPMERNRQLHHAEVRRKMPAVFRNRGDQYAADLPAEVLQPVRVQLFEIRRGMYMM